MKELIHLTQEYIVDAVPLIKASQSVLIQTDKQAENAKEVAVNVNQLIRRITERVKAETKPSRDRVATINAAFKTILSELNEAKNIIARKVLIYQNDEKRKQYRLEQEAKSKVKTSSDIFIDELAEVYAPKEQPKNIISTREYLEAEVVNIDLVPSRFLLVDHVALKAEYKANKQPIPGIKFTVVEKAVVR